MKLVNLKRTATYLGVRFPKGVPVELPADFPEDQAATLIAWGWTEVFEPTPNLRPADGGPVIDPSDPNPIRTTATPPPTAKEHKLTGASQTVPPTLDETTKTDSPVVDVEETKTAKPLEFHRNPAVVNRKK